MRWIGSTLIVALLIPIGYLRGAAEDAVVLTGDEIEPGKLKVGSYVWVTHCALERDKQEKAKGYIKAVDDTSFVVGMGLWREKIVYRDVIVLVTGRSERHLIDLQRAALVAPGERIRVSVSSPSVAREHILGTLVVLRADSLAFRPQDGPAVTVPLSAIRGFEVSQGRDSKALEGAAVGFLGSAVIGTWVFYKHGGEMGGNLGVALYAGPVCFGIPGALIGVFIGGKVKSANERWKQVPLDRFRLSILPHGRGRTVVSASFAF